MVKMVVNKLQMAIEKSFFEKQVQHVIRTQSTIRTIHMQKSQIKMLKEQLTIKKLKLLRLFERNRVSYVQRAMFYFNTRHENFSSLKAVNQQLRYQQSQKLPSMSFDQYNKHLDVLCKKMISKCGKQSFTNQLQRVYQPTLRKLQPPGTPSSAPPFSIPLAFPKRKKKNDKQHPLTKRHSAIRLPLPKKELKSKKNKGKHRRTHSASQLQIAVQRKQIEEEEEDTKEPPKSENVIIFVPVHMHHAEKLSDLPTEMVIQAIVKAMFAPGSSLERIQWSSVILFNYIIDRPKY